MMIKKAFARFKHKLLLLAGLGICGLAVLEVGQQMVDALEARGTPVEITPQVLTAGAKPSAPSASPAAPPAPRSIALDFGVHTPQTTTQAATQAGAQAAPHSEIAINTGTVNDPKQPVSQLTASQIATAQQWNGASFPVEGFQAYTSPFGYRSSPDGGYSQEFHYGLDMAAPEGSYVRNWWGGKVVEVSDDSNCGTSVVIKSGAWTHIYCHMQGHVETEGDRRYMVDREGGIQIFEGQDVIAGGRIGRVGMTGRTTGPHLHWGLKYNGNWVDPAYVLRAMYSSQQQTAMQQGGNTTQ